ncbi:hypothetical protein C8R44DRAFT_873160 [Mycena epipterygia]|nr:hypothetical protein C8R44DRAFT_873160 [Mycena epipterygia]
MPESHKGHDIAPIYSRSLRPLPSFFTADTTRSFPCLLLEQLTLGLPRRILSTLSLPDQNVADIVMTDIDIELRYTWAINAIHNRGLSARKAGKREFSGALE